MTDYCPRCQSYGNVHDPDKHGVVVEAGPIVVAYHVEDGDGRPAINVKDHNGGEAYEIALQRLIGPGPLPASGCPQPIDTLAYERIVSDFWQAAQEIATQRGLGEIAQEGRSGGWLVFTDGRDPQDANTFADDGDGDARHYVKAWLADYRAMVEWADAWIADAPRKVASLAQQYAMDEAGEGAARRMFPERFARRSDRLVADYRAAHPDTLIGEGAGA